MRRRTFGLLLGAAAVAPAQTKLDDPILEAMRSELDRSLKLRLAGETPYYIQYTLEQGTNLNCSATLGGLLISRTSSYRLPRVQVRVGSYEFDNTNCVYTGMVRGARFDNENWPLEADENQIRQDLWLATDRSYKAAVETLSLKRAAIKNVNQAEKLNDFAKQAPVVKILPVPKLKLDEKRANERVRTLSALFAAYPKILDSRVEYEEGISTSFFGSTEGTFFRTPENIVTLRVRAEALADDGSPLRDYLTFHAFEAANLPSDAEITKAIQAMATRLTALCSAPLGEAYNGPVLFEGEASAQLLAQMMGGNLGPVRSPVSEPGRPVNLPPSELEGRIGARVMPEFLDVTDDPFAKDAKGRPLFGSYEIDMEGVVPQALPIVSQGTLKNMLLTRQPVRGFEGSNGRARLPGSFGANAPLPSNLLVKAKDTVALAALKTKLIDTIKQRNKPYGIIVRKIDFPSSASVGEFRRLAASLQAGGGTRPISLPLAVYRVYPDGREELVRGMRFRGLTVRALRDILAASSETHTFDLLVNNVPLALMGAGGFVTGMTVVAPSLLFDEIDMDRPQEERPSAPVVPPPPIESAG